ncbi:MAG: PaaI family thioesterase [Actinobacteria bacterium]|nr:PaaI family thioesterase [Actinomycetota bacterium]MBT4656603.1 PaaI family thioesterase [Actinomycetota bacterium]
MPDQSKQKSSGAEVADQVRRLVAELNLRDSSEPSLAEAASLIAQARKVLDGPVRLRWYEVDVDADDETAAKLQKEYRQHSLFRGGHNPLAPPISMSEESQADGSKRIVGTLCLGSEREGPPRTVHGGMVAAVFDDVLSGVLATAGASGSVTGKLTVRYRRPTPINTDLRFEAWVEHHQGRRLTARAQCVANGEVTAEAEALFISLDMRSLGSA